MTPLLPPATHAATVQVLLAHRLTGFTMDDDGDDSADCVCGASTSDPVGPAHAQASHVATELHRAGVLR